MRMNADELVPEGGGLTQADNREVVRRLVEAKLLDFLDLDIAIEPDQMVLGMPSYLLPKHVYRSYVAGVREAAGDVPVLSGRRGSWWRAAARPGWKRPGWPPGAGTAWSCSNARTGSAAS
jgi:hypothetical protein